jgi:hypothetical protein
LSRATPRSRAAGPPPAERQVESPLPRRRKIAAANGKAVGGKIAEPAV